MAAFKQHRNKTQPLEQYCLCPSVRSVTSHMGLTWFFQADEKPIKWKFMLYSTYPYTVLTNISRYSGW